MTSPGNRPLFEDVLQAKISRRGMLKRAMAIGLAFPAVGSLLAACGDDDDATATPAAPVTTDATPTEAGAADTPAAESTPTAADAAPAGEGVRGGMLRVAIIGEPPAFDGTFTTATITANTTWHVFEPLFTPDAQFAPREMLLENYEIEDEGRVFIFHLRQNVPFHNGDIMNADDVIASLERYSTLSGRGRTLFGRVESLEREDDYTVRMTFTDPTGIAPVFLSMTDAVVIPQEIAEASPDGEMTEFIGTGPYRLNERLPDRYISIVRFEDYASRDEDPDGYGGGKTAYFDEIRFIPVPEQSVRADGLITDEFDYAESLSTDNYQALNAEPDLALQVTLPYYFYGAHFNKSSESMMSDPALRKALLTAVDMAPVATAGFGDQEFWRLGPEINAPETAWYTDVGSEHYDIGDTELARQMLEEAGYDGTPIRWISTREYSYNYNMALVMRDQMEAAGAVIDLQVLDWATLVATRSQRDAWDIFITGHPSYNHPILQVFLNETWPGFWSNERKDELVDLIIEEPDHDVQMGHIEELQQLWWDEAAMVKVCEGATLRGYRSRLKGYANPADWFFWNAWFEE
jgi:peptide/nickel transport system substrate-binding protein